MNVHIKKDISNAFTKLKNLRDDRKVNDINDVTLSLFKLIILNAINQIKQR